MYSWLQKKLKLSHHRHTGRRLPHKHTSHGVLIVLVAVAGIMLLLVTRAFQANALTIVGDGSLNLSGVKPRPRPTIPSTIEQPQNKLISPVRQIDIYGSCPIFPEDIVVKIIDNGIDLGDYHCTDGRYQLKIDLFLGTNWIRAREVDNFGQFGPESTVIKVIYRPAGSPAAQIPQLTLTTESEYFGFRIGDQYSITVTVKGGRLPYATNIDWGDGSNDVISRSDEQAFTTTHIYQTSAQYIVNVSASDSSGQKAQAQTTVLIAGNGNVVVPNKPANGSGITVNAGSTIEKLWPVYIVLSGTILVFWLGELFGQAWLLHRPKIHSTKK